MTAHIRQRIVDGEFAPGDRLPTRLELGQSYGAAAQTVQRAMDRLRRDGFIVTRGKGGTLVSKRPPHLHRYGFVTGSGPRDSAQWPSHFFQRFLFEEAMAMDRCGEASIVPYTMVDRHVDSDDFQRLFADVERHCLAGLIFDAPTFLFGTPLGALLDEPDLPAVTIFAGTPHPNLAAIYPDAPAVVDMALEHFAAIGCRRVALLASGMPTGDAERFQAAAASRGLETRSAWMQYVVPAGAGGATALCELMMHTQDRPDALLIADDCLVEPATRGLAAAGVHSENRLAVVAQANFPRLPRTHAPVRWIGFDIPEIVRACLYSLRERRAGRDTPPVTTIQPHWQEERARSSRRAESRSDGTGGLGAEAGVRECAERRQSAHVARGRPQWVWNHE